MLAINTPWPNNPSALDTSTLPHARAPRHGVHAGLLHHHAAVLFINTQTASCTSSWTAVLGLAVDYPGMANSRVAPAGRPWVDVDVQFLDVDDVLDGRRAWAANPDPHPPSPQPLLRGVEWRGQLRPQWPIPLDARLRRRRAPRRDKAAASAGVYGQGRLPIEKGGW